MANSDSGRTRSSAGPEMLALQFGELQAFHGVVGKLTGGEDAPGTMSGRM
jgi:hypothetical protein